MRLKLVSLLLFVALIVTAVAGCGGTATTAPTTAPGGNATSGQTTAPAEIAKIKFAMFAFGDSSEAGLVYDEINKITRDKIGTEIEPLYINFGAWHDQINLMLTSNEQLDLTSNITFSIATLAANGQIQPLDELVAEYGQGIVAALGEKYINAGRVGKDLYGITVNRDLASNHGFVGRKDLLEKYNLSLDNVKTIADLEPILQTIKDNEPGLYPLGPQAAPMMVSADWACDNFGDSNNLGVLMDFGQTLTVSNYYESDHYKNWVYTMYDWAQKGLIVPDIINANETGNTMVKNGKVFGYFSNLKPGYTVQEEANAGYAFSEVAFTKPKTSTSNAATICFVVPTGAKYPEKAVQFMNLWNTDPVVSNLIIYGLEGKHYRKVDEANGIIGYAEGVNGGNIKYPANMGWGIGNQFISYVWEGNPADYWQQMKKFNDNALASKAMGFTYVATNVANQITACTSVVSQYNNALMCGALNPAEALPAFLQALKDAGIDDIIAEKQAQLDAWVAANK